MNLPSSTKPKVDYMQIELPSKCLVYKDIKPTDIGVRMLKGKDEKLISELTYENAERKYLALLQSVIVGIDPLQLTVGDRLHILLWEAVNSHSPVYNLDFTCSICFKKVNMNFDLSSVPVLELPEDFKEPYPVTLSDNSVIKLRLFRLEDEIKIFEQEKRSMSSWLYRWALSIVDDRNIVERIAWLEDVPATDLAIIRAFHEKYAHGPKMELEYDCPECGGRGSIALPFQADMLCPYGEALKRNFAGRV